MNTIMIPTCNRPSTLSITLHYLKLVRGVNKYHIVFLIDKYTSNRLVVDLINDFKDSHKGFVEIIPRMVPFGLTKNILEGYKHCFKFVDDYVIILEDDIRLSADFLEYVEYCFENLLNEKTFGITGYFKDKLSSDVRKIYRKGHYFSLGTAVLKPMFEKYVLPHCNDEYYYNCNNYLVKHFPNIMVNGGRALHYQQAGLMNRIIKSNKFHLIAPHVPRSQHFGVLGGNRKSTIQKLSYNDQVAALMRAINNPDELAKLEATNYKDYIAINDDHTWEELIDETK